MSAITRQELADELAAELSAIADRISEKYERLTAEWGDLIREERHAASSIKTARDYLRRAVHELDGDL